MQLPNDLLSSRLDVVFEDVEVFILPGLRLWSFISPPQAPPPAPATEEPPSSQSVRMTRSMRSNNPDFVWVTSKNIANDTMDLSRHIYSPLCAGLEMKGLIWVCQIPDTRLVGESLVGQESTAPTVLKRCWALLLPLTSNDSTSCHSWLLWNT